MRQYGPVLRGQLPERLACRWLHKSHPPHIKVTSPCQRSSAFGFGMTSGVPYDEDNFSRLPNTL